MLIDLSQAIGDYLHDVFVDQSRLVGRARVRGAGLVHHALRRAMDRFGARRPQRGADGLLVVFDRRRRAAARLRALPPRPRVHRRAGVRRIHLFAQCVFRAARARKRAGRSKRGRRHSAAANAAKPRSRSAIRSPTSSSPIWRAHRRTARRPARCGADFRAVERDGEAFVAAPRRADAEQGQRVEEGVHRGLRHRLEDDDEQPAGAGEIAFPDGMARDAIRARDGARASTSGRACEPARDRKARFLVHAQAARPWCAARAARDTCRRGRRRAPW